MDELIERIPVLNMYGHMQNACPVPKETKQKRNIKILKKYLDIEKV
jgi:hypothetical protein